MYPGRDIKGDFSIVKGRADIVIDDHIVMELKPSTVLEDEYIYRAARAQVNDYSSNLNSKFESEGLPFIARAGNFSYLDPNRTGFAVKVYDVRSSDGSKALIGGGVYYGDPRRISGLVFYEQFGNMKIGNFSCYWNTKSNGGKTICR